MKMFIVLVCLLVSSTVHAALVQIDDNLSLDTDSMFMCQRNGLYYVGRSNPIIGGRILEGNKSTKFVIDTEQTKIGLLSETTFNSWGDIVGYTNYTKSANSVDVNVSASATSGNVSAVASRSFRVHSYQVDWQRPEQGTALEKYYYAALAQFEENSWKIAQQSGKYGFIEVTH